MPVVALPVFKLVVLGFKQFVSKPVSYMLQNAAKRNDFFRKYICMPTGQIYHNVELRIKMHVLNLGKPTNVDKLNESMAIDTGAEIFSQLSVFFFLSGTLTLWYTHSYNQSASKELEKEEERQNVLNAIKELEFTVEKQDAELRHITRLYYSLENKHKETMSNDKREKVENNLVATGVDGAKSSLGLKKSNS